MPAISKDLYVGAQAPLPRPFVGTFRFERVVLPKRLFALSRIWSSGARLSLSFPS